MVIATDATARRQGVQPGLPLAQARAMIPDLHVDAATPDRDDDALVHLVEWCLWLSPLVAIDPPDGVWIDTTGCDHLQGGEDAMLGKLAAQLQALGYTHRIALADTPGAASAQARFGRTPVCVVPSGAQRQALADLPIASLRLDTETREALNRLGLRTVGALQVAPRAPLVRRFGTTMITQLDRAFGAVSEPIRPLTPREAVQARETFVEPIGTAEAIATVIATLVPPVCAALLARGEGLRLADLICERVDGTVQAVRVGTAAPVRDIPHLTRLLGERIDSVEPGFGIEAMALIVIRRETLDVSQTVGTLVAPDGARSHGADLSCLIDRLRNRVGPDKVTTLHPHPSHLPERSQALLPVSGHAEENRQARDRPPYPRPVRLFSPPKPIQVINLLPDGAPRLFVWGTTRHRVRAADGPEQVHEEWWRAPSVYGRMREYWTAETESGERFWLFRRGDADVTHPGDRSWFLHGLM
ncbi:nucleotidyltransferase [Acetobacter nitrogenifigens DSM 23921 = NBRC 105050]|uniref:Nucleotidyltransferase n=1 Tax=Acetobacter nitrogenifigens DSM 23921 = NBRC 105050 TaxID=1120919 RepID=A0A511XF22_9PROT|nr:nucleotidyltransferase [Acetobacter nitrogenifigens DSM 23921 = NBRC 105050]GEN61550.1 nucleotidyltransferase [Acetobacter nitrogenifigens DSM 23921 = NBRC 105050]